MNTVEVDLETLERALDGDRLAAANLLASLPWWAVPEARADRSRALLRTQMNYWRNGDR